MDPGARTLQSNYHAPLLVSSFRVGSVVWAREEEMRPLRLRWVGWVGLDARDVGDARRSVEHSHRSFQTTSAAASGWMQSGK